MPMLSALPQRITLKDQTAAILREGLQRQRWTDELPPEPVLAHELQVGRNTIRSAIEQLVSEGLVKPGGPGRLHRIMKSRRKPVQPAPGNIVRYLSPISLGEISQVTQIVINGLKSRLGAEGYHFEFEHHPGLFRKFSERQMQRLAAQHDTAGWILLWTSREIQTWFAEKRIPCVVTGSLHPGISLPNVEFDFAAVSRHAVNTLIRRGHERIVFLSRPTTNASELAGETAFLQAVQASSRAVQGRIVVAGNTRMDICRAIDRLLATADRPTALFINHPTQVLTVVGHFHRLGLRIPQDMALICRASDLYMDFLVPDIARYQLDVARFSRESAHLLLRAIRHGAGQIECRRIMPEFVSGESL